MTLWPTHFRATALIGLTTALLSTSIHAENVDLFGVDEVTLGWAMASGPVAGYYVIVDPSDDDAFLHGMVSEPNATLSASPGDSFAVMVAAFDGAGFAGPLSPPSPTLRIHADAGSGDPPDTGDPPPGDEGDPPPPEDGDPLPEVPDTPYDFDGDGPSDLLVREQSGGIALWRMAGSAVLASVPLADDPGWDVVGSGDYDGNGSADLLWEDAASGARNVWLLRDGTLGAEHPLDLPDLAPVDEWRVGGSGDFDGDGQDDVVLFSRILGECEILYMREGSIAARERMPGYRGAWSVDATDDVDGDGIDEIVWRDEARHELVLWDLDAASDPVLLAEETTGWRVIGSGDYDGDGRVDLFAEHAGAQAAQVWIQGGSSIAGIVDLPSPGSGRTATHVGDYDFDGRADLVWSDAASGDVEIWFSDGDGVTAEGVTGGDAGAAVLTGEEGSDDSEFRERLCNGDFNGDGVADFVDVPVLSGCFLSDATGACRKADMDGNGSVDHADAQLFKAALMGEPCGR